MVTETRKRGLRSASREVSMDASASMGGSALDEEETQVVQEVRRTTRRTTRKSGLPAVPASPLGSTSRGGGVSQHSQPHDDGGEGEEDGESKEVEKIQEEADENAGGSVEGLFSPIINTMRTLRFPTPFTIGNTPGFLARSIQDKFQRPPCNVDTDSSPQGSSITLLAVLVFLLALAGTLVFYVEPAKVQDSNLSHQVTTLDTRLSVIAGKVNELTQRTALETLRKDIVSLSEQVKKQETDASKQSESINKSFLEKLEQGEQKFLAQISREDKQFEAQSESQQAMFLEHLAKQQKVVDVYLKDETVKLASQAQAEFKIFSDASSKKLLEHQATFDASLKSQSQEFSELKKKQEDESTAQRKQLDAHFETHNQQLVVVKNKMSGNEAELRKLLTMGRGSLPDVEALIISNVDIAMDRILADHTGLPDHALYSAGGRIVAHSTLYTSQQPLGSLLKMAQFAGLMPKIHPHANKWVLSPMMAEMPGHCLALNGTSGYIDIKLRIRVLPTAFTLEHVHKSIAFNIESAPKSVKVMGWDSSEGAQPSDEDLTELASIKYDNQARPVQSFVAAAAAPVDHVRLSVLSNHGLESYTCIYRFRVHGTEA